MAGDVEVDNLPAVVARMSITNSKRNAAEGTTNMSIAAIPVTSLRRNLRQVGDGAPRLRTMYLATVA